MRYVIIGNSTAAIGAVEGIREIDKQGEIIIISDEVYEAYSRPLISYYLSGKIIEKNIYYRDKNFYVQNGVALHTGQSNVQINPETKIVWIEPGSEQIHYDKLLIATGGKPVVPDFLNGGYDNVFLFHSFDDVKKIDDFLKKAGKRQNVAIIGGGLVGLKAAESMFFRGQDVAVVEAGDCLLNSILDLKAGNIVENYLKRRGISIFIQNIVEEKEGEDKLERLILSDGTILECDMVIAAAGIKPNYAWLNLKNLKVDKGILVDEYLQTSIDGIYAAGDVAQAYEIISGEKKVVPILPNAYIQGRIAGANMAGENVRYRGSIAFNSIPLLGLNIVTAGLSNCDDRDSEIIEEFRGEFNYKKFILKDDVLVGTVLIGDIYRCGIYRYLIEKKIKITDFKQSILSPEISWRLLGRAEAGFKGGTY
ncbi:FAD-dependent oxidoreductase [Thermosyntropha sp.]|uniref:NAD(P)/FAD-dependent oxidoreductase n=1 Tax=Thermosyntropha sp. TaxID=2740820 RepID=UPI0025DC77A3|nr:FAD-dependent oxidoreductase [Thermosyntropha sp.]MBO8159106.1 NAD(P)/FAD-dependent oxidoreductase [Thermosyntropha sp.]